MRWWPLCFFVVACTACRAPVKSDEKLIQIHLSKDSQSVIINGLDYAVLQELKKDSLTLKSWQALFPVYRMPADTDMADMQPEQPGTYAVADSAITFKPDTAFKKYHQYFAKFFGSTTNYSTGNMLRSKTNLRGQNYTEVLFKF